MKLRITSFCIFLLFLGKSFAQTVEQPGVPAPCNCKCGEKLFMVEGLMFPNGEIPSLKTEDIESVHVNKLNQHEKIVEIYTKNDVHTGLRYIRKRTNSYTKSHPYSKMFLDNQLIDNVDMRNQLLKLSMEEIINVELNEAKQIINITTHQQQSF